jgi:hypothetical protein
MKSFSTLIFISFLFAISCTNTLLNLKPTDQEIDSNLIELNKEPVSEGVFATMATQLSTEGGFTRVLTLLHGLVADGKSQLHQITLTWRGVSARCSVSKVSLASRQEFFNNRLAYSSKTMVRAKARVADNVAMVAEFTKHVKVYKDLLTEQVSRHSGLTAYLNKMSASSVTALKSVTTATNVVKDWTPKGAALVQTMLSGMVNSYAEISQVKLDPPSKQLQEAGADEKVKARMLQWLGMLKARLLSGADNFEVSKELAAANAAQEQTLGNLVKSLEAARTRLTNYVAADKSALKDTAKLVVLLQKLVKENAALILANKAYCANESTNFHRNEKRIRKEITLFREITKYFNDHYSRVHSFIRNKYNN